MNTTLVLAKLDKLGVAVVPSTKDSFKLRVSSGSVPEEAVKLAREHKPALLNIVNRGCSPHNEPENYIDESVEQRPGWIRTKCRVCGKFIGYRST